MVNLIGNCSKGQKPVTRLAQFIEEHQLAQKSEVQPNFLQALRAHSEAQR
jgi:hypothetical protein